MFLIKDTVPTAEIETDTFHSLHNLTATGCTLLVSTWRRLQQLSLLIRLRQSSHLSCHLTLLEIRYQESYSAPRDQIGLIITVLAKTVQTGTTSNCESTIYVFTLFSSLHQISMARIHSYRSRGQSKVPPIECYYSKELASCGFQE